MPQSYRPIVYVRGYAGTETEVEQTVDDPFYGFNFGSTHYRVVLDGSAEFYAFESPLVRLLTDHGYADVFSGGVQSLLRDKDRHKTIWIYRYYDPTSKTFDRPGGRRLSIDEAAGGLRDFIDLVKLQTQADKVYLVAHSMGGLVCRSLLQKIYPKKNLRGADHVDKLFTYGTPHDGIHFEKGAGYIEKLRDAFGVNNSDDFGPERMYQYLTPKPLAGKVPASFRAKVMPLQAFDPDRVFCIVGTNARDYEVAYGLSRFSVGPQSDGLVQIQRAYVEGSHCAYIHRSHSGRYGMVNSEEGYQNLQRFLFGDVKVKSSLRDVDLVFPSPSAEGQISYQVEVEVSIRGLPMLMHQRIQSHYSPISLNRDKYRALGSGGLPLFSHFLMDSDDKHARYMIRLAVYRQKYREGYLELKDHIECLPLWSDYLVVDLRRADPKKDKVLYRATYGWASVNREPYEEMIFKSVSPDREDGSVLLPARAHSSLGKKAKVWFETYDWS